MTSPMHSVPTIGLRMIAIVEIYHFCHSFASEGDRHSFKVAISTFPWSRNIMETLHGLSNVQFPNNRPPYMVAIMEINHFRHSLVYNDDRH